MKKALIFFVIFLMLILAGCQKSPSEQIDNSSKEPDGTITIRSIDELNHMHSMLSCTDQETLTSYLRSIEGGGAHSKEDIEKFTNIVDSIPFVKFIDGDISWISYKKGTSQQSGEQYEILYITVQSQSGDWVRFEYILSITDTLKEINTQTEKLTESSVISQPVSNSDKRITFYSEVREKHISGIGDTINWIAVIDGIYTNIIYYSTNGNVIDTNEVVSAAQISLLTEYK